jgi:Ca-activated chloride channel homolog
MSNKLPYINIIQSLTVGPVQNDMIMTFDLKILPAQSVMDQPFYDISLIDTSGSMGGSKFKATVDSLIEQVQSLPHGTIFTLIGFGPVKTIIEEKVIDDVSIPQIVKKIRGLSTPGSTPMYKALESAMIFLKKYNGSLTKKIILMTDGYPDKSCSKNDINDKNLQEFLKFGKMAREYRGSIDTVGALKDHNVLLLYELAKQSTGKYIFADTAQELKEKMTIASHQATQILFSNPTLTITPTMGSCDMSDAAQYKPTIIRIPFERIGNTARAYLRSFEAGDTYQILVKLKYHFKDLNQISLETPINILNFEFDLGGGLTTTKQIMVKFTSDPSKFKLNQAINRQYVGIFDAAEEIHDATIKGDAARTQMIQGDETKKV